MRNAAAAYHAMASNNHYKIVERTFTCSDGVKLAARCWLSGGEQQGSLQSSLPATPGGSRDGPTPKRKILCLHGWLDNSASFNRLASNLCDVFCASDSADIPTEIVALDFPGHGLSGHKSVDGPPQLLAEYAYYVAECVDALQWDRDDDCAGSSVEDGTDRNEKGNNDGAGARQQGTFSLVGHSMGGGVAVVFGAAFPELIDKMVLLEGAGPLARNAKDCGRHVRAACSRRLKSNKLLYAPTPTGQGEREDGGNAALTIARSKIYSNLSAAVEARINTTRRMPGDQYLSMEAARDLVERATVPARRDGESQTDPETDASESPGSSDEITIDSCPVVFRHDPRLQWPSLQYYTREQVEAFYEDIQCPVCLLMAEDGWPSGSWQSEAVTNIFKPQIVKTLPGSHHFHADPDSVDAVASNVASFLLN